MKLDFYQVWGDWQLHDMTTFEYVIVHSVEGI